MTTKPPLIVFLFDLIQDISVLRPLVRVLAAETPHRIVLLHSHKLARRDKSGVWRAELAELAAMAQAQLAEFDSARAVHEALQGNFGLAFSASETDLPAHEINHQAFRAMPSGFVRITIQHGHECVGFRQNLEQTLVHGDRVRFAADVVCGWGPLESMTHMVDSERPKFFELGPTMVLDRLLNRCREPDSETIGLICENLHSVRMRTTGDFQTPYIETLRAFAASEAQVGRRVGLRPHPGGQFVLKNKTALPGNVELVNRPMYKTDLARFAFGISAPSSVLVDMALAGIPTAVWQDTDGRIDTSGYVGLARVGSVEEWTAFASDAVMEPGPILARQQEFLSRNHLAIDAATVRDRLLELVDRLLAPQGQALKPRTRRVMLVANAVIPTLEISFIKPLEQLAKSGAVAITVVTEAQVKKRLADAGAASAPEQLARKLVDTIRPQLAVFCRYSGPLALELAGALQGSAVPVIFHMDDDLLHVPADIGPKFVEHNRPERTGAIRTLLERADLVYASTARLEQRLAELGFTDRVSAGAIYCSGEIVAPPSHGEPTVIGFMGNDKTPELAALVPELEAVLEANPAVRFELFGSMAMPKPLERFGTRVSAIPRISDYNAFVAAFRQLRWHIGLAPLRPTPFNLVKADTKWVDYTSIGAAVVASIGTAYDRCAAEGCGVLVSDSNGWRAALQTLIDDPEKRMRMVEAAQRRLAREYTHEALTRQVLAKFALASGAAEARRGEALRPIRPTVGAT